MADGEAQKFSMRVTLPTVSARLVKHNLSRDFVYIGELFEEALSAEFGIPHMEKTKNIQS